MKKLVLKQQLLPSFSPMISLLRNELLLRPVYNALLLLLELFQGNLGLANALYLHLASKLPISRLQRDLTDSTVIRNVGVPLSHSLIAFKSIKKGASKLVLNRAQLELDLSKNWAVVAEAIQNILRRESYPQPYEALKALTRTNTGINADSIASFVDGLDVNDTIKSELKLITPSNYTGI